MRLTGISDTDLMLDDNGQPVVDVSGTPQTVQDRECWMQDIRCEMLTEEGELLHEDEEGKEAYGYGLFEFLNARDDISGELQTRIFEKLSKRSYIDESSITVTVSSENTKMTNVTVSFKTQDGEEGSIEIDVDGSEVYVE